jgi:transcriptional regulator with XRE-family HTH domain
MQTRLREVRKALKLTLSDVAERCRPPTTAQTIGRLETGTRTVSLAWLNRIAEALRVEPSDLVTKPVHVVATLTARGAEAVRRPMQLAAPQPKLGMIGLIVEGSLGDYRSGDQLWLDQLEGEALAQALNTDCLVPLAHGGFAFGRLITLAADASFSLLPLGGTGALVSGPKPAWIASVRLLVRNIAG